MINEGDWVRINRKSRAQSFIGGKVLAVNKTKVTVKPIGHRRTEVVELADCHPWKSKNSTAPKTRPFPP